MHTNAQILARLVAMGKGLTTEPPGGATDLVVEGKTTPVPDLAAEVQRYVMLYTNVVDSEQQLEAALLARNEGAPDALARVEVMGFAIIAALGKKSPKRALYGLTPFTPRRKLTAAQLVVRANKSKATRVARGTKGSRQKAAIHGEVPTETTTPEPTTPEVPPKTP